MSLPTFTLHRHTRGSIKVVTLKNHWTSPADFLSVSPTLVLSFWRLNISFKTPKYSMLWELVDVFSNFAKLCILVITLWGYWHRTCYLALSPSLSFCFIQTCSLYHMIWIICFWTIIAACWPREVELQAGTEALTKMEATYCVNDLCSIYLL